MPLDKVYDPLSVEAKWVSRWQTTAPFHPDPLSDKPAFSMVIPPPNVTGSLHLGHALNTTLQDILARWKRMKGFNVLWVPGTDHAGIATQNVVERQMAQDEINRQDIGRDSFIQKVWAWKKKSGGTIIHQLKQLGASCDWERERFTLDEGLSQAVTELFVRLHQEGLIYRDKRLVNICFRCGTALSDIEVEHQEIEGRIYHIKYPIIGTDEFLTVATTRPETMLADYAVAVHPEDPRYRRFIGQEIRLPLTDRTIPIVGDPILVDREFGTGAVKITPGHDFNDEQAGKRHRLEKNISLLNSDGTVSLKALYLCGVHKHLMNLAGQSLNEARKIVLDALQTLLIKEETHLHAVGVCYRCKTIVEPYPSIQWFVRMNDPNHSLAKPAIDAVCDGRIRIIPEGWKNNYLGWMENIQDWCISRQIWWGHSIPAWYCEDCNYRGSTSQGLSKGPDTPPMTTFTTDIFDYSKPVVQKDRPVSCSVCGCLNFVQDPDVLDTWFSSALWPFSTLGWPSALEPDADPEKAALFKTFYPTTTLISGFDILFFWVARMIMMGLYCTKQIPFCDVYIHALVRDAEGQKMSKSKGNVIDPLQIMGRYGTDALRFTLAAMASPGRDIKLSEQRIAGYRNFINKIWNAARFILSRGPYAGGEQTALVERGGTADVVTSTATSGSHGFGVVDATSTATSGSRGLGVADATGVAGATLNRWICSGLDRMTKAVDNALERYRVDEAAEILYQFVWHKYCDWYLELVKVALESGEDTDYATLRNTFHRVLLQLSPFIPFITAELLEYFPLVEERERVSDLSDEACCQIIEEGVIEIVSKIRNLRGEMNISPSEQMDIVINLANDPIAPFFLFIQRLARIRNIQIQSGPPPERAAIISVGWGKIYLLLNRSQIQQEIVRLGKVLEKIEKERCNLENRMRISDFVKAPQEIQEETRRRFEELTKKRKEAEEQYARFQKQDA